MLAVSTSRLSGPRRAAQPRSAAAPGPRRAAGLRVAALFGFGGGAAAGGKSEKELEKEEQFRIQQELIEKRRTGSSIRDANERRRKVSETLASRKAERREEREALGRGEMPESLAKWKNYKKKEDADGTGGIIVPLNPLGMRMFDEGERFDLRSPYSDDGWVDPEETDAFASFRNIGQKLLNFGQWKEPEKKPIIWASQWEKMQAAKKGGKK